MSDEVFDPKKTLEVIWRMQRRAEEERRYKGNHHMKRADNISEHIGLALRLGSAAIPELKREFPNTDLLLLYPAILHHDDDELGKAGDTAAFKKPTELPMSEAIEAVVGLNREQQNYILDNVQLYKKQMGLISRLAKVFDRLDSNLRVIDEIDGIIQPDHAKLTIEYVIGLIGISKTTDALINAQVNTILELRSELLKTEEDISRKKMLSVNLQTYRASRERAYISIDEYYD